MRTWDSPAAFSSVQEAFPSLVPEIANAVFREPYPAPRPGLVGRVGSLITRRLGREPDSNGFPSYEAAASEVDDLIEASYSATPENFGLATEESVSSALLRRITIFNQLTIGDNSQVPIPFNFSRPLEERRDSFTEALAGLMQRPDSRANFLARAAAAANTNSGLIRARLRNSTPIAYDYVVRGDGVHAANVLATIQECDPAASILVISNRQSANQIGGQFRGYGERPVFDMNSRNRGVFGAGDIYGIPKQGGNLNSMGLHAALQLPDFVGRDKATNVDMGHAAAVNIALSGADILFCDGTLDSFNENDNLQLFIDNFATPIVTTGPVIEATGIGTPDVDRSISANQLTAGDLLRAFGSFSGQGRHPAELLAGKEVLLAGCGDSAKCVAMLALGLGPSEAYRGWSAQRGALPTLNWVADEFNDPRFTTKRGFQGNVRSVYSSLAAYMPDRPGDPAVIQPIGGRLARVEPGFGIVSRPGQRGGSRAVRAEVLVRATGVTDPNSSQVSVRSLRDSDYQTDRLRRPFTRASAGGYPGAYLSAGPVTDLLVRNNAGVPENTASIWNYAPAATLTGYEAVRARRRRRQR